MPAKNSIKQFVPDGYYHIYNRGVEKRIIFQDFRDYSVFLSYLNTYLLPKDVKDLHRQLADPSTAIRKKDKILKLLRMNNFSDSLSILCYCLMPNHFHLLVKQTDAATIDRFMNSLATRYSMYFNRKYRRVGSLFQDVYKAVLVTTDEQLLHLSRYIHRNPSSLSLTRTSSRTSLRDYPYSSYSIFLHLTSSPWVHTEPILSFFSSTGLNSYASFVEDVTLDEQSNEHISSLALDFSQ